ncbi:large-conductance mechanosensitive channel [Synechocystis sp. PCC 6803]|uniref:Large-conductance mechanosensitive channel n=1 Tax=Synechocystis sp. (strain ATCC 27184 / PCC 6803 / Kazusa) TaxID=1111708 RepID=MSCL_SYNY3|nr:MULTISPECIES: large conductance mechanosensitive channel protein MscL [unclassified Synechocystis]P73553.1 RecName: Full=Large-conductance mechanosensitive channel [Synechocystis sp. PCC 6803 substr. Kazusa]BAM51334.1 large-conductance mechanosensitive channel [Synechocystis sp. PCC 6803] [Bacillus subtilis BEST7613]AGF51282.1 large-conductance mechanosensitive channel [Synechocystis sp. PCC 6803]ALJ67297.1 mechanosensitive ion channel protein MscL [Synechocystis sp. PCC 6803]AVP89138.1 lar
MVKSARQGAGGFWRDFKDFILRGNVVDLAVAVVIGGAFTSIVNAFVAWLMAVLLQPVLDQAGVSQLQDLPLGLGELVIAIINFLIIAFVIFLIIKAIEKMQRKKAVEEEIVAEAQPDPVLEAQTNLTDSINRLITTLENQQSSSQ